MGENVKKPETDKKKLLLSEIKEKLSIQPKTLQLGIACLSTVAIVCLFSKLPPAAVERILILVGGGIIGLLTPKG